MIIYDEEEKSVCHQIMGRQFEYLLNIDLKGHLPYNEIKKEINPA